MRKVILNMSENYKYKTIKSCYLKRLSKQGAATRLDISIRQVNRLIKKYECEGKAAFIHGNKGKHSKRKVDDEIRTKIISLYHTKYEESNCKHFTELLEEHEAISVSETFVRKLLHENDIYPPRTWKRTKKRKKSIMKVIDTKPNEDITICNFEVPIETLHPAKEKKKYFGEEVQMDASDHLWFGDRKSQLHAAIDNSTGNILALYFDWQETLKGYYNLYAQILHKYGIPYEFSTDRRTVFEYKKRQHP